MSSLANQSHSLEWWLQKLAEKSALQYSVSNDPLRRHANMDCFVQLALNLSNEDNVDLDKFCKDVARSKDSISDEGLLLFAKLEAAELSSETPHNERDTMFDQALSRLGVSATRLSSFEKWIGSDPRWTTWHAHSRERDTIIEEIFRQEGLNEFTPYFTTRCSRRRLKELIGFYDIAKIHEAKRSKGARKVDSLQKVELNTKSEIEVYQEADSEGSSASSEHRFISGVCKNCGCSEGAITHFGYRCRPFRRSVYSPAPIREGGFKSAEPAMTPAEADRFAARMAEEMMADPALRRSVMTKEERTSEDGAEMLAAVITAIIGVILTPILIGIPILIYAVYRMFAISFRS